MNEAINALYMTNLHEMDRFSMPMHHIRTCLSGEINGRGNDICSETKRHPLRRLVVSKTRDGKGQRA